MFPDACPVPLDQLQDERVTEAIYEAEMRDHVLTDTITDNWRQDLGRELVAKWVGETIFQDNTNYDLGKFLSPACIRTICVPTCNACDS